MLITYYGCSSGFACLPVVIFEKLTMRGLRIGLDAESIDNAISISQTYSLAVLCIYPIYFLYNIILVDGATSQSNIFTHRVVIQITSSNFKKYTRNYLAIDNMIIRFLYYLKVPWQIYQDNGNIDCKKECFSLHCLLDWNFRFFLSHVSNTTYSRV